MSIRISITEEQARTACALLEQLAGICENAADRFTMGRARTLARDLEDSMQRMRMASLSPATPPSRRTIEQALGENEDGVTRFIVPGGIGDDAWCYLKAAALAKRWGSPVQFCPVGDHPRRAQEFIELLPGVSFGGYSDINGDELLSYVLREPPVDLDNLRGTTAPLCANFHLEAGKRIEEWYPEVDATFDLKLKTTASHRAKAKEIVGPGKQTTIGVYPAAYGPARGWSFFGISPQRNDYHEALVRAWADLVIGLAKEKPDARFVLIGATFDQEIHDELGKALRAARVDVRECVGQHFGVAAEVLKACDLLVAFPSGIPIVATLLGTPTVWWLPDRQVEGGGNLKNLTGWTPPGAIEKGLLATLPFAPAAESLAAIKKSAPYARAMRGR